MSNSEEELIEEVDKVKFEITADRLDMSFGELISMYSRGELIINPEFQRLFRWSNEQKTRFIESILLGMPIPSLFVSEDMDGHWELIDGLQRVSTVISFFGELNDSDHKNNWKLARGDFIKTLEDHDSTTLPTRLKMNIRTRPIRIEIVKYNKDRKDLKYELFKRLNTGGSHLTEQEIRNAIFRGISDEFNNLISKLAENEKFIQLILPTEKQIEEKYPEELVLRFISLYQSGDKINTAISLFMTDFMENEVKEHNLDYSEVESLFNELIDILDELDYKIFRAPNGIFSASLYDGIMMGISSNLSYYKKCDSEEIFEKIQNLKNSEEFKEFTGSSANSKQRVKGRIREAKKIFDVNESD